MYMIYLDLLKMINKYRAMIFYSNFDAKSGYQITVGIKNENNTIYIQKDCRFSQFLVTVYYSSNKSQEYELEHSELISFLDMHLLRKDERQVA
ncbi:MAG: hypothetical protein Q8940_07320 [Bacteroidota bacterium]|nr:hypothetical protein [Bacteroidota bacterium]